MQLAKEITIILRKSTTKVAWTWLCLECLRTNDTPKWRKRIQHIAGLWDLNNIVLHQSKNLLTISKMANSFSRNHYFSIGLKYFNCFFHFFKLKCTLNFRIWALPLSQNIVYSLALLYCNPCGNSLLLPIVYVHGFVRTGRTADKVIKDIRSLEI